MISKEVAKSVSLISKIPLDDYTYSPKVPCPSLRRDSRVDADLIEKIESSQIGSSDIPPIVLPLSHSGVITKLIKPRRNAVSRTFVGFDDNPSEYWFHNKIHTLGNTGAWGGIHALLAPLVTRMIDDAAYDGINVRQMVRTFIVALKNFGSRLKISNNLLSSDYFERLPMTLEIIL